MAADGDGGTFAGDIAVRLETKTTSLGPLRAGLIYAPGHGLSANTHLAWSARARALP